MANKEKVYEILKEFTTDQGIDLWWSENGGSNAVYILRPAIGYGCPTIMLGADLKSNPENCCFALAHELGHHILHRKNINPRLYHFGDQKNENYIKLVESEANAFAKGLLRGLQLGLVYDENKKECS